MKRAFLTVLWALILAGALSAGETDGPSVVVRVPGTQPARGPAVPTYVGTPAAEEGPTLHPDSGGEADVILPTDQKQPSRKAPRPSTGPLLVDRVTGVFRDSSGTWWAIPEPRARRGALYLLPGRNLEAIEELNAAGPVKFKLSGEIFFYEGHSYLMVRKMLRVEEDAASTAPTTPVGVATAPVAPRAATTSGPTTATAPATMAASAPATATAPAASAPAQAPDMLEAEAGASAEEIARMLLSEKPGRPVVPVRLPPTPPKPEPSVAPAAEPIRPGPGGIVIDRLARVVRPRGSEWALLVFESDNTLKEPPLRILPSQWLQAMEDVTAKLKERGAIFHISGEVHRYHGKDYVLIRWAFLKKPMDEF